MNDAIRAIARADDFSIVRAFEYFHRELSQALQAPLSELEDLCTGEHAAGLLALLRDKEDQALGDTSSILLAREILVDAAEDPGLQPVVLRCVTEWPDDRKSVGLVLEFGILGLAWLIAMTTEVRYKDGRLEVHKRAVSPHAVDLKARHMKTQFEVRMRDDSPRRREQE